MASSAISRDRAACRIAVTRQRTTIVWPCAAAAFSPSANPASTASTTASSDSPAVDVQFGGEPDLGVDDVVAGQVLDALDGHPVQRVGGLHDPDGVGERLEVPDQRAAVRGGAEERRQRVDVGGRQLVVAVLLGQLEHRLRTQTPVEVVVQQRLGRLPDGLQRQRCRHQGFLT